MKNKKKLIIILSIILIIVIAITIGIISSIKKENHAIKNIIIENIDLTQVKDGKYQGSCSTTMISVIVDVTVANHKITAIDIIKHDNGKGTPAEAITDKVINAQSLEVDAITGATGSSICILKAIEDALKKGI
jgi:uncharacterized protein with FMN-binding domain